MTLNDIIYAALRQLERGTDAQTVDKFRRVFTDYANSGQRRLANRFKVTRLETVTLDDMGRFNVDSLERSCVLIEKITDGNGAEMSWGEIVTGLIEVTNGANADVNVYYRYMPREMSSPTDVPELPSYMHSAIPYYVVGCQRCGSDADTQATAGAHFDLFNREVSDIYSQHYASKDAYTLKNMGW
ncbi:MAG: hypothetical protein KIG86_11295 [Eubacteriales bacterium]|nr:hypothetical protein [Eubacteriales bacterium]